MDINEFIKKFSEQFDETDISLLKADVEFRSLEEWSSMTALGVIGMVDVEYGVEFTGKDIQACNTIQDIFDLIESRKIK